MWCCCSCLTLLVTTHQGEHSQQDIHDSDDRERVIGLKNCNLCHAQRIGCLAVTNSYITSTNVGIVNTVSTINGNFFIVLLGSQLTTISVWHGSGLPRIGLGWIQNRVLGLGQEPSKIAEWLLAQGCFPNQTSKVGFLDGVYWSVILSLLFLYLRLQSRFWVSIVSGHNKYTYCAVLQILSPPAFRLTIRQIIIEWQWKQVKYWVEFVGSQSQVHNYCLDRNSESGRWVGG